MLELAEGGEGDEGVLGGLPAFFEFETLQIGTIVDQGFNRRIVESCVEIRCLEAFQLGTLLLEQLKPALVGDEIGSAELQVSDLGIVIEHVVKDFVFHLAGVSEIDVLQFGHEGEDLFKVIRLKLCCIVDGYPG